MKYEWYTSPYFLYIGVSVIAAIMMTIAKNKIDDKKASILDLSSFGLGLISFAMVEMFRKLMVALNIFSHIQASPLTNGLPWTQGSHRDVVLYLFFFSFFAMLFRFEVLFLRKHAKEPNAIKQFLFVWIVNIVGIASAMFIIIILNK